MTYKVWLLNGFSAGSSDIEYMFISSDDEEFIKEFIESMGGDVLAYVKLKEGEGVSEGVERTHSPSLFSPSLCEVLL